MSKKKIKITRRIERVLLTEVLPYETPLIFSNRSFYSICCKNDLRKREGVGPISDFFGDNIDYSIPFDFYICREEKDPRLLSVIHPAKQIEIVRFYEKYKDIMLYYASKSPFSIRKPIKIGRYYYATHKQLPRDSIDNSISEKNSLTINSWEDEGIYFKNFFSYYHTSYIYEFYESKQYQKCEKYFLKLYRFDINKCFDSIYTHSIAWAIYSKEFVKEHLNKKRGSFADNMDRLMSTLNYNETSGILIGPEFSRIFAEIILQRIDRDIFEALKKDKISYGIDYKIFRYVDDYFLFFNEEGVRDNVLNHYTQHLKKFKMSINKLKSHQYDRPIITELSNAKKKIKDYIFNQIFPKDVNESRVISNKMITDIKIFIRDSGAKYEGITNYLLALLLTIVERKQANLFTKSINNILEFLDFMFFIFSTCVNIASINKISHIVKEILKKSQSYNINEQQRIIDRVFYEIEKLIGRSLYKKPVRNKEIYLLILLREKEIYEHRQVDTNILEKIINNDNSMDYFDIIVLLFYMGDDSKYLEQKKLLRNKIIARIQSLKNRFEKNIFKNTEATLLFFDLISCPFIEDEDKQQLMDIFDIDKQQRQGCVEFINKQGYWFTKWVNFNLLEEIRYKKLSKTYS